MGAKRHSGTSQVTFNFQQKSVAIADENRLAGCDGIAGMRLPKFPAHHHLSVRIQRGLCDRDRTEKSFSTGLHFIATSTHGDGGKKNCNQTEADAGAESCT